MVLSMLGMSSDEHASKLHFWDDVAMALSIMASKGIIDKEKFDSFYIPVYGPREQEVREIILEHSSFFIKEMHMKGSASVEDGQMVSLLRAVFEPIIVSHFGEGMPMDEFVETLRQCLWIMRGEDFTVMLVSLIKS